VNLHRHPNKLMVQLCVQVYAEIIGSLYVDL
jgi:hypothetical protein